MDLDGKPGYPETHKHVLNQGLHLHRFCTNSGCLPAIGPVDIACVTRTSTDHLKTFPLFLTFSPAAPLEELLLRMESGDKGAPQHEL